MRWYVDRLVTRSPDVWDRVGVVDAANHPRAVAACVERGLFTWKDIGHVSVWCARDIHAHGREYVTPKEVNHG